MPKFQNYSSFSHSPQRRPPPNHHQIATTPILSLRQRLAGCGAGRRCGSGACATCVAKESESVVEALQGAAKGGALHFVTVIPDTMGVSPGTLDQLSVIGLFQRLKSALKPVAYDWAFFAIDGSMNRHETNRYAPFWCVHLHGVVANSSKAELEKALRWRFEATDAIPKPVSVRVCDGSAKAFKY